jgi:hypothetical protein
MKADPSVRNALKIGLMHEDHGAAGVPLQRGAAASEPPYSDIIGTSPNLFAHRVFQRERES